jgi:hypothetical protein
VLTGLLGRFDAQVVQPASHPAGGRTWQAAGDPPEEEARGLSGELYLGGGLGLGAGLVGIGVGFCIGCGSSSSWNIGCYAGVALLIAGAAMIIASMVVDGIGD